MTRLGYICDGCGREFPKREPAAAVQDDDLDWYDLCSSCYDRWEDGAKEAVLAGDVPWADDGPAVRPDGGTTSKYVNPTGEGYAGIYRVSGGSISIGLGIGPVEWTPGEEIPAIETTAGVALDPTADPADPLGVYTVRDGNNGPFIEVRRHALAPLGVSDGDDVRAYDREAGGLLLVAAREDPRVRTDGGQPDGPAAPDEQDGPELSLEDVKPVLEAFPTLDGQAVVRVREDGTDRTLYTARVPWSQFLAHLEQAGAAQAEHWESYAFEAVEDAAGAAEASDGGEADPE